MNARPPPKRLRPEDVVALGAWLKAQRMRIDPAQLIAATRLLGGASPPPPLAELAPWLAPIFCTSAEEQEAFARHYGDWLAHRGWRPGRLEGESTMGVTDEDDGTDDPEPVQFPRWIWLSALVLLCAALLWYGWPMSTVVVVKGNGKVLADASVVTSNPAVTIRKNLDGQTVLAYFRFQLPLTVTAKHSAFLKGNAPNPAEASLDSPLPRLELTLQRVQPIVPSPHAAGDGADLAPSTRPGSATNSTEPSQFVIDYGVLLTMIMSVLIPLAWWLYTAARRRGFLERMPANSGDISKLFSSLRNRR